MKLKYIFLIIILDQTLIVKISNNKLLKLEIFINYRNKMKLITTLAIVNGLVSA